MVSKKLINIGADVEDTYFKFQQQAISDIVDALHKNDIVDVFFTEGVALEELNYKEKKFLSILEEICERNNWPKNKINFILPNLVQNKSVWPSIELGGASILIDNDLTENIFLGLQAENIKTKKDIQKTFGIFVNRSQWDRLLLSGHLYNNHREITMQTYRKDLVNPGDMIELGIDQLFWKLSSNNSLDAPAIQQLCNFISSLPHDRGSNWSRINQQSTVDNDIRSFRKFWDESYDYQQGVQRTESIQRIIDELARLPINELRDMYQEMSPILEHNYKLYMDLTGEKILSTFGQKI